MCLIVVKTKKESSFSIPDFRSSFARNSDGTGIMYVEDGRVKVEKTMGNLKDHLNLYYKHMHKEVFVLHHRMATHGDKSLENVHPFKVLSIDDGDPVDLYFAHNGIFQASKFDSTSKSLSDTHMFALEYMQPLLKANPLLIDSKPFQAMLHDFIGHNNKLAFLRNDGSTWIFNKTAGDEHNGCWLSNKYSVANSSTAKNHGKHHGAYRHNDEYDKNRSDVEDYYSDIYGYNGYNKEDWRPDWKNANTVKNKKSEFITQYSIEEILDNIDQYSGMTLEIYKQLCIDDVWFVYDMINLLSFEKKIDESLLEKPNDEIAHMLFELMQSYAKAKAA